MRTDRNMPFRSMGVFPGSIVNYRQYRWSGLLVGTVLGMSALLLSGCSDDDDDDDEAPPAVDETPPPVSTLDCNADSLQMVVSDATIDSAEQNTTEQGESFCRVDGHIMTEGVTMETTDGDGLYGEPNQVNFMLSLPTDFSNRYYFVGLGGSAGYVPDPPEELLAQGYAIAGTDAGSPSPGINWTFAWDRTKALDYANRGVHLTTQVTQDLTDAFYGEGNDDERTYNYLQGCSGGGRMGQVETMLYPNDYDGIVAGAPGLDTNNQLFFGKIVKRLIDNPDAWVSPQELQTIEDMVVSRYDNADGVDDGLIWDHSRVDTELVQTQVLTSLDFTPAQLETLRLIIEGMDDFGQSYPGFSVANPIGWSAFLLGTTPPPWSLDPADENLPPAAFNIFDSQSRALFGPDYDFTESFDFGSSEDVNAWHNTFEEVYPGSGTAHPEDMQDFKAAGGKILYWHGEADNGISVNGMTRFYDELAQQNGGYEDTRDFARLFLAPGVQHCGGGIGPQDVPDQALSALVQWVEEEEPPRQLVTHSAPSVMPERSFLLCPYPQTAAFSEEGDLNDAANYSCEMKPLP